MQKLHILLDSNHFLQPIPQVLLPVFFTSINKMYLKGYPYETFVLPHNCFSHLSRNLRSGSVHNPVELVKSRTLGHTDQLLCEYQWTGDLLLEGDIAWHSIRFGYIQQQR